MADTIDLTQARERREARRDTAMLELFSAVLRKPLERRELTPEQQEVRLARVQARSVERERIRRSLGFPGTGEQGIIEA